MVSVVSSRVRPSLSSGKATKTTSSTKAPAAISPAISPTDTRGPVWELHLCGRCDDRRRTGRGGPAPSPSSRPAAGAPPPAPPRPRHPSRGPPPASVGHHPAPARPPAGVEQGSVRPHPVVDDPDPSGAGADRLAQLQGHDVTSGPVRHLDRLRKGEGGVDVGPAEPAPDEGQGDRRLVQSPGVLPVVHLGLQLRRLIGGEVLTRESR